MQEEFEEFLKSIEKVEFYSMKDETLPEWKAVYGKDALGAGQPLREKGLTTLDVRYDRIQGLQPGGAEC